MAGPDFKVNEKDWTLVELLCDLQFASQLHFFGDIAEEAAQMSFAPMTGKHSKSASAQAFDQMPPEFTYDDVMRITNCNYQASTSKVTRWKQRGLIERMEGVEGKPHFKKAGVPYM